MSLQTSASFANGLTFSDTVHKILSVTFNEPETLVIEIGIFIDLVHSQNGVTQPIERRQFRMTGFDPAAAQNVHTQAYTQLKTFPEYSGAIDV